MTEAKIRRMHKPVYDDAMHPPLPARVRLAANAWERVWRVALIDPVNSSDKLPSLVDRFSSEIVTIRTQMRTHRLLYFAVITQDLDEQNDFELAMLLMAYIEKEIGTIERIEDRPAHRWPVKDF
ncbi:hypothetical protein REIFOR_01198 [Reinekea forsetii]|jgi:hypothetical protein|uniref:Uncharacterized protein n=2 Tax=Saccharospirillaceae TaxID=255527 RepID=A0A2K8KSR8_9GAMM|nr:hypothetical protein REIFOR_01198 [Reinekea forsetii]